MKYSEFPYKRLTVDSQNALMEDWLIRFNDAESAEDQITVLEEVDDASREYASYVSIASLNFSRNITMKQLNLRKIIMIP